MSTVTREQALEVVLAGELPTRNDYFEVPSTLFIDPKHPVDLPPIALFIEKEGAIIQLRTPDQPFPAIALSSYPNILIKNADAEQVMRFAQTLISGQTGNGSFTAEKRFDILHKAATRAVDAIFTNPSPENIKKGVKITTSMVHSLIKDPKSFPFFNKLSHHDAYTAQHSIGTAVNSIMLARKLQIKDPLQLIEVGLAGLLHDVGKVKVKKEIINKPGPLDECEWEEMRQHSSEGYEIVKNDNSLTDRCKKAILEHHEDKNGTGYPKGKRFDDVDLYSKIVGISDVFNAITTNRSYSKARTPFEAFQIIRDKLRHKIDDELLKKMILMYGGEAE